MTDVANDSDKNRGRELIERHLAGSISDDETREMEKLLISRREAREELRLRSNLDAALRAEAAMLAADDGVAAKASLAPAPTPTAKRWSSSYWSGIAAGLLLGLFSGSLAFGYFSLRNERRVALPVADASFEIMQEPIPPGFPRRAGVWQGDQGVAEPRPEAQEGTRVLRLDPVRGGARQFSFVHQIVPVDRAGRLEVEAAFLAAEDAARHRHILRVSGYEVAAEQVRSLAPDLRDDAVCTAQRAVFNAGGRQRLSVMLEVPPGTRCIVIDIGSRTLDAPPRAVWVDDVKATLVVRARQEASP